MIELKMKDKKVQIKNQPIAIGSKLDFQAVNNNFVTVKLSEQQQKLKIISSVPSLDTNTCALQTKQFCQYAAKELTDFLVITISKDLPFAQKRFCASLKPTDNFVIWSDYQNSANSFASQTNLLIDELQLLTRTILILNEKNEVIYQQIVKQVAEEPNYQEVIDFLKNQK